MDKAMEMKMVSMKRTADDKRGDTMAGPSIEATAADYPYGLCLRMDKDELDKLGIKDLPKIGAEMMMMVKAKVTRVSQSAAEGADEQTNVEYQITDIGLETE